MNRGGVRRENDRDVFTKLRESEKGTEYTVGKYMQKRIRYGNIHRKLKRMELKIHKL